MQNRVVFLIAGRYCMLAFPSIDSCVGSLLLNYPHRAVFPSFQRTFLNSHLYPPSTPSLQVSEL